MSRFSRFLFASALALLLLPAARADRVADLIRIHVEAMGGRERIAALKTMQASGQVIAGGKKMRFTFVAARPDRVRVETQAGGRTLVQASDGVEPPWEFDTGQWPPHYRPIAAASARTFVADAEFDDPLVAGASRGFTIEDAGELEVGGRKLPRLLVTRKLTNSFWLLLDPDTFLIVMRIEDRTSTGGRAVQVVTRYADFRPVEGVLLPHEISLAIGGQPTQQTKIDAIQPNPEISDDAFTRPRAVGLPKK